jgi:hypothetical protein
MRLAARRSLLLRKILASDNEYLDSISTYINETDQLSVK